MFSSKTVLTTPIDAPHLLSLPLLSLSYLEFSSIAAKCVRSALKTEAQAAAAKRQFSPIAVRTWENGVAGPVRT